MTASRNDGWVRAVLLLATSALLLGSVWAMPLPAAAPSPHPLHVDASSLPSTSAPPVLPLHPRPGVTSALASGALPHLGSVPVGVNPEGIAYSPTTGEVYVANQGSDNVSILRGNTGQVLGNLSTPAQPDAVAFDPATGDILVADAGTHSITVINSTNTVTANDSVGADPVAFAYDPVNHDMYVSDAGAAMLSNITPSGGTGPSIALPHNSSGLAFDAATGDLYVGFPGTSGVGVVSPVTGTVVTQLAVGGDPAGVAVDSLTGYVDVANSDSGNVSQINPSSNLVVGSISVALFPRGLLDDPANGNVYVADSGDQNIAILTGTTLAGWMGVGSGPVALALDPTSGMLFVADSGSNAVSLLNTSFESTVTFTESGLPSGTHWSLRLGGIATLSTGSSILFSRPNATYAWSAGSISGYAAVPSSGYVIFNGTAQTFGLTFEPTYRLSFTEQGLPSGTSWWVTVNGTTLGTGGSTITFNETNGSYTYFAESPVTLGSWVEFTLNSPSGAASVAGQTAVVSLAYAVQYQVSDSANNPALGTVSPATGWYPGNQVLMLSATANPGDSFTRWLGTGSGSYTGVTNPYALNLSSSVNETAEFSVTTSYPVTFTETGLPSRTVWNVQVTNEGVVQNNQPTITFNLPNGTYSYEALPQIGTGWVSYIAAHAIGNVTVQGGSVGVSIAYGKEFRLTNVPAPAAGGAVSPLNSPSGTPWWPNSSTVTLSEKPSSGFYFMGWIGNGTGSYTGSNRTPTITMDGPINETARFGPLYTLTFRELGLRSGTIWSVTLNGTTLSTNTSTVGFTIPTGTYPFTVSAPKGYQVAPSQGRITVSLSNQEVALQFTSTAKSTPTVLGLPWWEWVALGVVAVIVVVAAFFLIRRGPRHSDTAEESSEDGKSEPSEPEKPTPEVDTPAPSAETPPEEPASS